MTAHPKGGWLALAIRIDAWENRELEADALEGDSFADADGALAAWRQR